MGAKQSKRSVDISGKEAEGGGEVAAAGAAGEGRVEPLADADALKPQLNGDAHIQTPQTDKEKELDSGTPENEKDATTEKEGKEEDDKEKEQAPVTNGEPEPKENGESTPSPEDGKKPKKEKVKKKWSLRSISFSRKDKPKQEKKQKEEEAKTNGEPEKVPEETAEAVPEATASEVAEEAKAPAEEKDEEKTPETPVTEPLTNGTSTPESTKAETPASEEDAPAPQPEELPVNGLSLEETKPETPVVEKPEETKPEPPATETAEIVPAPEIPKEVCVERMPLLEPTPPPLPANPPPSSVASFAATTMAPELADASLPNTADAVVAPLSALPETKVPDPLAHSAINTSDENKSPFILKENKEVAPTEAEITNGDIEKTTVLKEEQKSVEKSSNSDIEIVTVAHDNLNERPVSLETKTEIMATESQIEANVLSETPEIKTETDVTQPIKSKNEASKTIMASVVANNDAKTESIVEEINGTMEKGIIGAPEDSAHQPVVSNKSDECDAVDNETPQKVHIEIDEITAESANETSDVIVIETEESNDFEGKDIPTEVTADTVTIETLPEPDIPESEIEISEGEDSSLPPPPAHDDDAPVVLDGVDESLQHIPDPITEGGAAGPELENSSLQPPVPAPEHAAVVTNGISHESSAPAADYSQEPLAVSDKLADMIPEVPDVPELKPETLQETVTDVAVAN